MAVSDDRKYTKQFVFNLLESIKGKTLGEVDASHQFSRTQKSSKITGIAGDVIEQSVFGYARDSNQECDIEIDGVLTELKTTGVRIPKSDLHKAKGKTGNDYNALLGAKEGISITGVTFEPTIECDFFSSHFWEKAQHLLIVFYEYSSYDVVPASAFSSFRIVDYCYNTFSTEERDKLKCDWDIVSRYLQEVYSKFEKQELRYRQLEGFTHRLRPELLLIELVPGFKRKSTGSYQKPRYRLKQSFIDYLVKGHFSKSRNKHEIMLKESFSSFEQLDARCHALSQKYRGKTLNELSKLLGISTSITTKDIAAKCVLRMFDVDCSRLNQITDFTKAGIIAKTITLTTKGNRTEDMKLQYIHFDEWSDRDIDFEDSEIYTYFCEHSFLCPIFCECDNSSESQASKTGQTTFEGFKRFSFNEDFIQHEVRRTWEDSRALIHQNKLKWEYIVDKDGNILKNKSGSYKGAPNFPKSSEYTVFFRGGSNDSSDTARKECVNNIKMLPQFFWLKGTFITDKLRTIPYI